MGHVRGGSILHLRWQVDPARPWAGVSPLQHAADTGSLVGWIESDYPKRPAVRPGAFSQSRNMTPTPRPDLDGADADDPLAALRRDIGAAKGQVLAVRDRNGPSG